MEKEIAEYLPDTKKPLNTYAYRLKCNLPF